MWLDDAEIAALPRNAVWANESVALEAAPGMHRLGIACRLTAAHRKMDGVGFWNGIAEPT